MCTVSPFDQEPSDPCSSFCLVRPARLTDQALTWKSHSRAADVLLLGPPGPAHGLVSGSARPACLLPLSCYAPAPVTVLSSQRLSLSHTVSFDPGPHSIMRRWPSGSATVNVTLNPPCMQMTGRQVNASAKASGRPAGSEHSVHAHSSTFPSIVVLNRTILCAHPRLVRAH